MMIKNSVSSMTSVFITILITMALFYASYEYIDSNYSQANIEDQLGYNESYDELHTAQDDLSDDIDEVKTSAKGIVEADGNALLIAWNGLTGLAATIAIFFGVIDVAIVVFDAIVPALAFLPGWVKVLINMGIIITMVLLIIGLFKGESKT